MTRDEAFVNTRPKKHRYPHNGIDDMSIVSQSTYDSSYTAASRKTVQSMKLSSSASALNQRVRGDNIILDDVLEGISAMTNFLDGNEQKRTSLSDLSSQRINLDDCLKLKQQIRDNIRNSKREKRNDLFTAGGDMHSHTELMVPDDVSLLTTESSVQFSYMRSTGTSRRARSPEDTSSRSPGLFLTDDDRDNGDTLSNYSFAKKKKKEKKSHSKKFPGKELSGAPSGQDGATHQAPSRAQNKTEQKQNAPVATPLAPLARPIEKSAAPVNFAPSSKMSAPPDAAIPGPKHSALASLAPPPQVPAAPIAPKMLAPLRDQGPVGAGSGSTVPVVSAPSIGSSNISVAKSKEWVAKQLEWRLQIETRNRTAKKASELESVRGLQQAPDIKKAQRSWKKLKKTQKSIASHLEDSESKQAGDDDDMSLVTAASLDSQQSLKLQKLNNDIMKLLKAKEKGCVGGGGKKLKGARREALLQDSSTSSPTVRSAVTSAEGEERPRDGASLVGEGDDTEGTGGAVGESPRPLSRELSSFGGESIREGDCEGDEGVSMVEGKADDFFDSDFDSGDESDDNMSTYTADQSLVGRDLPPLAMKASRCPEGLADDASEEEDDDPLYLPTHASEFGTPRPWSLLSEEEKLKITKRTERRNRGLDLYAVKVSSASLEGATSSRALVSTTRSDQSDYEADWERANEKASLLLSPLKSTLERFGEDDGETCDGDSRLEDEDCD